MNYFLIEIPPRICLATDPVDDEGRFVEHFGTPTPWEIERAFVSVPYLNHEKDVESADELPDVISVGLDWLTSERLLAAMTRARIDPKVGFLPTVVRNRQGATLATYHFVYSRGFHEVIDFERSGAKLFDDGAIDEINKWVLQRKKMPEWDMFLAHDKGWIASERMRDIVKQSRLRGMNFRRVTCTDRP